MNLGVIIIGAGRGRRMQSSISKVMHPLAGWPMINHVVNAASPLSPAEICVVVGLHNQQQVQSSVSPVQTVLQKVAQGTADAIKATENTFKNFKGTDIIILYGDTPLITTQTIKILLDCKAQKKANIVLSTFLADDPTGYGRILVDGDDDVEAIVEEKDATEEEKDIRLCNGGMMVVDSDLLYSLVKSVKKNSVSGEYYLTDIIHIARQRGYYITHAIVEEQEVMGCDSKLDLAIAESFWQNRRRMEFLQAGVLMSAPETVYFSWDTKLGRNVSIEPNVVFGKGVKIGDGVRIRSFSYLEDCVVGAQSSVGPYARLRIGSVLGMQTKIGNFVEVKNSRIDDNTKINHLSYIGDSEVGKNVNIGAGTITCNYNGFEKFTTIIKDNVSVGANTALVAPVAIGDGVIIGAGSVVTKDVPGNALVIARANQENLKNMAEVFRLKHRKGR